MNNIEGSDERDKIVAEAIMRGECPFGMLKQGQTIANCPLGFPGCGCADEMMLNKYLSCVFDSIAHDESEKRN